MRWRVVTKFTNKKGRQVVIRYPRRQDLTELLSFANHLSAEDTFVMLSGERISKPAERKYLYQALAAVAKKQRIHLVATVDGKIAANSAIAILKRRKDHVGELNISVAKEFREEGIGRRLLAALISEAQRFGLRLVVLTCMANNPRAIHVYEQAGFRKAGVIPGVYSYRGAYVGELLMYLPVVRE